MNLHTTESNSNGAGTALASNVSDRAGAKNELSTREKKNRSLPGHETKPSTKAVTAEDASVETKIDETVVSDLESKLELEPVTDQERDENSSKSDSELEQFEALPPKNAEDISIDKTQENTSQSSPIPRFLPELTKDQLLGRLQKEAGALFFHDQHGNPFGWIPIAEGTQQNGCLPLGSKAFQARLMQYAEANFKISSKTKGIKIIKEVIETMKLLAFKEPEKELANRHRSHDNEITIDLGDSNWSQLTVTSDGYKTEQQSVPLFFRPKHMKALPEPMSGGDPFELFKYIQVESEEDKLLILAWVTSALNTDVPSPILTLTGTQGSAKTTMSQRLRDLTDPSKTPVLGDLERSNLFLTFQHHAVPCFENVAKFSRSEADMFCRAVTGNGVERRKLFTNSDQVLFSFRRPIIINGIDTPSTRSDFLDRCIVINCRRVKSFRPIKELDQEFQKARPRLFGALLDLLVMTLKQMAETPSSGEFRMADFAHFGRSLAAALGKSPEQFDKAYRLNIRNQDKEALDATPMTIALKVFATRHPETRPWKGSAQELLGELQSSAKSLGDSNVLSDLPKSARWLSSRLGELVTALATEGIIIDRLPRTSVSRGWKVYISKESDKERRAKMTPDELINDELEQRDLFQEADGDDAEPS
ncbi:hypothetical protein Enr10x_52350 [Gimesia panareensis]|uniref:SF3 helicase domain-containing protein n=1 Tax=Gimesia panareensis TaxID=2527978 RepID=A0A517QE15_9PLAN|nr:hypothetical protein [Gimesia panareensis]QDT29878.1 hypothetical protein Enr10x_52350 [Gimesia panareensis]